MIARARWAALAVVAAACGSFEDPSIILNLRPIAVVVDPPEQVVDVDPENPLAVEFEDVELCALVADPLRRELAWSMVACPPQRDLRCTTLDEPFLVLEPRVTVGADAGVSQEACATLPAGPQLTAIIRSTIENDSLGGFGGVDINVSVRAVPVGEPDDEAIYAGKAVRFSVRLPAERVANQNPIMTELAAQLDRGNGLEEPIALSSGGCRPGGDALVITDTVRLKLSPRPLADAAETYVVPTFEGGSRTFTENLRYQWLATGGSFSRGETGGPRDAAGNPATISTEWRPAKLTDGETGRNLDLWVVQRDERGGTSWLATCIRVVPPGRT